MAIQSKYEEKLRKQRWKIFWSLPAFFLLAFPEFGAALFTTRPLLWFLENVRIYQLLTLGFIVLGVVSQVVAYRKYREFTRDLGKEEEDSVVPSSVSFRFLNLAIHSMLYLTLFMVLLVTIRAGEDKSRFTLSYWNEGSPVIALEELEMLQNSQVNASQYVNYEDYGYEDESIFLDEKTYLHQTGEIGLVDAYRSSLISTVYEPKTQRISSLLERELIGELESLAYMPKLIMESSMGVHTVYMRDGRTQYLLISDDNRLLRLEYQGDVHLPDWKTEIIEQFLNAFSG